MSLESVDFEARIKAAMAGGVIAATKHAEVGVSPEDNDTVTSGEDTITQGEEGAPATADDPTTSSVREKSTHVTRRNLWQHPDAHPLILDLMLLRKYGPEWMTWESETLEWRAKSDFNTNISSLNMHKIQAAKTLHFIDTFWHNWEVFVWCTMALNGVPPDFLIMQVPTVTQCMISVDIANQIRRDVEFNYEIIGFLETVFLHESLFCSIAPLDFVKVDWQEYPVDYNEVMREWETVAKTGRIPTEETVTAEQLRRMLEVKEYLADNRAEFNAQLPLVVQNV